MTNSKTKANSKKQQMRKSKRPNIVQLKQNEQQSLNVIFKPVTHQEHENFVAFVTKCEDIIPVNFIKIIDQVELIKLINSIRPINDLCTFNVILKNLLCNCTIFIENMTSYLKRVDKDIAKLFITETNKWYDTNINYKISCAIRNLIVHVDNCVIFNNNNNYVFDNNVIMSDKKCMSKIGHYLNTELNVMDVISSYITNIVDIQKTIFDKFADKIQNYVSNFESRFGNIEDHTIGTYDRYTIYIHMGYYRKIASMLKHGFNINLLLSRDISITLYGQSSLYVAYSMIIDTVNNRLKNKFIYTDELFTDRFNGYINNLCNVVYNIAQSIGKKEESNFLAEFNNNEDVKFSNKLRKKQIPLFISYKLTEIETTITFEFNDIKYKERNVLEYFDTLYKLTTKLLLDTQIIIT